MIVFLLKEKCFQGEANICVSQLQLSNQILSLESVDNYIIASKINNDNYIFSDSAHNIFGEILAENGLPGLFFFSLFCALIIYQAFRNKNFYGLIFIYLLLNFQTDYTYQIYSFLIFFIITSALSIRNVKELKISTDILGIVSLLLFHNDCFYL